MNSTIIFYEKREIIRKLREHLASDGTLNDSQTDALYRRYHQIGDEHETDLETVERWAVSVA